MRRCDGDVKGAGRSGSAQSSVALTQDVGELCEAQRVPVEKRQLGMGTCVVADSGQPCQRMVGAGDAVDQRIDGKRGKEAKQPGAPAATALEGIAAEHDVDQ